MEIRTKHVRAGFAAGLEGLKAMEIGAKQYDKEGALFWTSKRKKKQARKNGPPQYLRPVYIHRTPPFLTWARPIFEQGALSPMSVLPANFPILCLPGDKLFQSKDVEEAYCLPPIVHAFHGSKVGIGRKLQQWKWQGLRPLAVALMELTNYRLYGPTP